MNGKLYHHHHPNHHYSNGPRVYEAPVVARSKSDDEGDEELITEEEEEDMEEENHSGLKPNLHLLKGHTDAVRALRMLPDGTTTTTFGAPVATSLSCCYVYAPGRLASGSWDKTIRIWSLSTAKCLARLTGTTLLLRV